MARRTTNPFDPNADPYQTAAQPASPYIPQGVGMSDPNATGIPQTGAQLPPMYSSTPGGYSLTGEFRPPTGGITGGINPDGAYSGTTPPAKPAAPSYSATAPAGWNAGKWADQSHTTPKYVVGRILSQFPDTPDGLQQALPQIQAAFPGATLVGKDSLNIPGIGIVDVGVGFSQGGGQGWAWQPDSDMAGGGAGGAGGADGSGGYGSGGGFNDAIRQQLMAIMGQSQNPTDSPTYKNAVAAYDTQQQRNMERERNAIAERMGASGQGNSGAMDSRILGAEQARGESTANFAGQLAVRQLEQQRDEIMQALQMGMNYMTEGERMALTEKLGLINANLQQQGITNQNNQYNSSMGWEQAQYTDMMNRIPWQILFGAQ